MSSKDSSAESRKELEAKNMSDFWINFSQAEAMSRELETKLASVEEEIDKMLTSLSEEERRMQVFASNSTPKNKI
ncbi:hypothetical protein K3495_g12586 [Podosphaera aphanis]|nr:hypothetical protein K3495_g12586 [Podosphaera aphanis]